MSDAETTLRTLLDQIAEKQHYDNHEVQIKKFSTGGANYTSELYKIDLSAPGKEDLKLFAKIACVGKNFRARGMVDQLFVTEQLFYNKIIDAWTELQEKYELREEDKFIVPKYFAGNPTLGFETVILENLTAHGYTTFNRFKAAEWAYVAKSMETLAKFHALSFIHKQEYPDTFDEIAEQLEFKMPPQDETMTQLWGKMVGERIQVLNEEDRLKVVKFFESANGMEMFARYKRPRRHPVLIHGDYRPSNLMHKEQDGNFEVVPVDYQTIHTGCPVVDLVYFMFLSTDQAFRAKYWDQVLDHYHQELSLALQRFQMDPEEVYSRKEFDEDLKETLPYALLVGVMILPVVTVEEADAPQMTGDAALETFIVKPNDLFAERFTGLVHDCIRLGVI